MAGAVVTPPRKSSTTAAMLRRNTNSDPDLRHLEHLDHGLGGSRRRSLTGDELSSTEHVGEKSTIAWKRRSGFGMWSKDKWVKRYIVLRGTKLLYYKLPTSGDVADDEDDDDDEIEEAVNTHLPPPLEFAHNRAMNAKHGIQTGANRAKGGFEFVAGTEPRGSIDLAKEEARVGASSGNFGAPTPYAISIKVGSVTVQKFCFESRDEQMDWLQALTDVVVATSVQEFYVGMAVSVPLPSSPLQEEPSVLAAETPGATSAVKPGVLEDTAREQPMAGGATDLRPSSAVLLLLLGVVNIVLFCCPFWVTATVMNGILLWLGLLRAGNRSASSKMGASVKASRRALSSKNEADNELDVSQISSRMLAALESSHFKPVVGSTTLRLASPKDDAQVGGHRFGGWRAMPGSLFQVRSHSYVSGKKVKIPSPSELYDLVNVDIFESRARVPEIAPRVRLPEAKFDDKGKPITWQSPDLFVVSFALPTEVPKIGRSTTDGEGYTVTMYYRMKEETRAILRRVTSPDYEVPPDAPAAESDGEAQKSTVNAVRLFEEWCCRSPTEPEFQARFKVVPNAHNLKEIGVPSWIAKYNGKPFLIKKAGVTGFLYQYPKLRCMEFDISLHAFPYLFKQGTAYMKDNYFKLVLVSFGFVIEGRSDDELPEVVIGEGMQLCYPDPAIAIQAEDLFNGTSPKSNDPASSPKSRESAPATAATPLLASE